ncbi:MAG: VWA domain-containing protein [Clostridium sp.]|nr:VWA domain-containing protein [Clostridium sp.]
MTIQNLWPLAFLILIPVIILLYLLKQKAVDTPFSSNLLWKEIYKNLEAKTPFEKLKQNILMYLQLLLMLLLILALTAPVLKRGGLAGENVILVMDTSASMEYRYDGEDSRLASSIKEAKRQIDGLSESAVVTLIACDSEANVIYQGSDKTTLKNRLSNLQVSSEAGTLNQAAGMVNSLISGMDNVVVICYTDTDFDSGELIRSNAEASLFVEAVYSQGENCSVDYVNYTAEKPEGKDQDINQGAVGNQRIEALCKVTNYGTKDVSQDVSLYVDQAIVDVQAVTIPAGESATVYFAPQNVLLDEGVILKAELSARDDLNADNSQSIEAASAVEKKILLLSDGNVFLEKALSLSENVEVYKSNDIGVLNQSEESFDLYVFDGITLPQDFDMEKLPENAAFFFLNYPSLPDETSYIVSEDNVENAVLHFTESPVTDYVEEYSFGVTKTFTYMPPDGAVVVLQTEDGKCSGYYGTRNQAPFAVLGFDIHNTDLALQTEFPIFMSQLTEELLGAGGGKTQITNFPVLEESDVEPVQAVSRTGEGERKMTGGRALRNILLAIVIVLLVIEWMIYIKQVNSSKKKQFLAVRSLLLLCVILAMAGISISKKQKKSETIFLVDISDSMSGNMEDIEEYIQKKIQEMPEKNLCGVVAFGKDTAVDQFLSEKKIFSSFTVTPVTTATNIENALQNASSLFDEGVSKRIVLLTDGNENEGSMSLAATALKGSDIELYTIALEDCIGSNKEVYIDGLTVPSVVHVGDHYNVTVSVTSNVETNALLSLYAGRTLKGQQDIRLNKGTNQFVFEDEGVDGTIAQYKAVIEPEEDTISVNNTYAAFSQIEAKPRVLLIEGTADEGNEFEKVLAAANINYDKVTPKGVPTAVSELNQYKAVITLNVHYDDLRNGFARSLASYVKDFAGGYICIGGDNSYALGNYRGTELEDILPVYMDLQGEKEVPKMAMAMVIDQSGSMSTPADDNTTVTGLDLAKQAARSGVEQLRTTDEIGIMAFDDTYHWIVPIRQADNIMEIKDSISSIDYGGGTSIYPAFQEAYVQMVKSDAKLKHIILLTDGQDGFRDYRDLVNRVNEAGITVSTVAVGYDADKELLEDLAKQCGGRYYYTDINNSIPRIFAQEVYLSTNTYLMNGEFYPTISSGNEMLDGVFDEGCPSLYGYIAATPKQTADVLLMSDREDPVLSTWQCGLGRTVAWNSDGNNEWTAEYAGWENYPLLWSNIINYVISDTELGEDTLEIDKGSNTATVSYETKEYDKNTKVTAVITDENGNAKETTLDAIKPGSFEAELAMDEIGVYNVSVRKQNGEEILKNFNTAYANQYSAEYQFNDSSTDLSSFVNQAEGRMITMEEDIWTAKQEAVKSRVSLTVPLLVLAVFLLLFDIAIRRLSIDVLQYIRLGGQAAAGFAANVCGRIRVQKNEVPVKNDMAKVEQMAQTDHVPDGVKQEEKKRRQEGKNKQEEKKHRQEGKKRKQADDSQNEMLDMNALLKKKKDRES